MFDPTRKQLDALANMESYAGIRSHRTSFDTRQDFRDYWDRVSARADRTTRERATRDRRGSPADRHRRRQERSQEWYRDEEHLLDYGRRYARRYRPSGAKLHRQLADRCGDEALAARVTGRLADLVDDAARSRELAASLRAAGKDRAAIRSALRRRLFAPTDIDRSLAELEDATGSTWDPQALGRKVAALARRGLSRAAIRARLATCAADRPAVDAALAELASTGDAPALATAVAKLRRRGLDDQTVLKRLAGKGFRYADIIQALASGTGAKEGC